jgi:toxin-antitoxin system PIN domain toxin
VTPWLLDVNILVARFWERHPFHGKVRTWMDSHESDGWATCPITQLGVIRTISNPAFDKQTPRPAEVMHWMEKTLREHPAHQFWPDDVNVFEACRNTAGRLQGFRQLTDAYLLGLAIRHNAGFVTLDRRILDLVAKDEEALGSLVILN